MSGAISKPRLGRSFRAVSVPFVAAVVLAGGLGAASEPWTQAGPNWNWSFPRDHYAHRDFRIEWWYLTGNLQDTSRPDRRFGYQFTVFRVGLTPRPPGFDSAWDTSGIWMGHAALGEIGRGRHRFSEVLWRDVPLLAAFADAGGTAIAHARAPAGSAGEWRLSWNGDGFDVQMTDDGKGLAFTLSTHPLKPLVFQGPNGLSAKVAAGDAASLYYSFTRMKTLGVLAIDGERVEVVGESWMDHEFSTSQLAADQAGWDWMALRLDDRREIMIYVLRAKDGSLSHASATIVAADGQPTWLGQSDFALESTSVWRSPESDIEYPATWKIDIPGHQLRLVVTPEFASQENIMQSPRGLAYWEGSVEVGDAMGRRVGLGYVELTGYGGRRPPVGAP